AIAASTGGPDALRALFRTITPSPEVAYFVVIHGPAWMQHSCAEILQKETPALRFVVATHGTTAVGGTVYLAPGDKHLVVKPGSFTLALTDDPLVNFVRPAADPLFDSVAAAFDRYSVGVVLTGLGVDGAHGAGTLAAVGGRVLIQDPATAVAPPMPEAARRTVSAATVVPLVELGAAVARRAGEVLRELHTARG
ncbi:MAG: CheB methylesterase domain-containing protein, partial [Proteobacteria bacterium]|nr:CheB methylesterase domain-containing protein [Pseudomonadota bacterium]